jgi:predicted SAM-dependent methyltransferase
MFTELRRAFYIFRRRRQIKRIVKNSTIIKINIGSGSDGNLAEYKDWICVDKDILDITNENDWLELLGEKKVDCILAEHVWEHLNKNDTLSANRNCYEFLRLGGSLRIAVPDGFHKNTNYIDYVKPNGTGSGSDDHKILYNFESLSTSLNNMGFKVNPLEYWTKDGRLISSKIDPQFGPIKRSAQKNIPFENDIYTSLIIDAIK